MDRCIVLCLLASLQLCGIALMALGLFVLIQLQSDELMRTIRDQRLEVDREVFWISIGMIGLGFIVFLVGFCGCCGAVRDSATMSGFVRYLRKKITFLCIKITFT
jgi:hypothetical protein